MGCAICRKKQETDVDLNKTNENGYKDLFYATNEFDLSRSESENEEEEKKKEEEEEEENYSLNTMNMKQQTTKKVISFSNELNSINNTSSTIVNDIVNNEIVQIGV